MLLINIFSWGTYRNNHNKDKKISVLHLGRVNKFFSYFKPDFKVICQLLGRRKMNLKKSYIYRL